MISGRKESVIRHINNPRIHVGRAIAIPYVDYISRFKNGTPVSSSAYLNRSRIKFMHRPPIVEETFYDKLVKKIEEINVEKFAEGFTNTGSMWLHQGRFPPRFPLGPLRSMLKQVTHYTGGNIFAIRGRLCPKCTTIEPIIYGYGSAVNASLSSILYPMHPRCTDTHGMSSSAIRDSLKLYTSKGFPEIVRDWVKILWSSSLRMRITALKVPGSELGPDKNNDVSRVGVAVDVLGSSASQLLWSTGNSATVVSLTFSNGENDKLLTLNQKEIILHYVNSDFINLPRGIGSQSFPQIPNLGNSIGEENADRRSIIEKAIESSDIIINTEDELLEFLRFAKFGTFGFFRIGPASATSKSLSTLDSEDGYLLLLTPYEFSINRKFRVVQTSHSSPNNNPRILAS
jgi:hypothetical protein